jgi:hypothetical protein
MPTNGLANTIAMNVASPRGNGSPLFRSTPSPLHALAGAAADNGNGISPHNNNSDNGNNGMSPSNINQITQQVHEHDMVRLRSIFNPAQETILHLMQANLFARFRLSPIYENWLEEYRGGNGASVVSGDGILGSRGPMQSRGELMKKRPRVAVGAKGKGKNGTAGAAGGGGGRRGSAANGNGGSDDDYDVSRSGSGVVSHGSPGRLAITGAAAATAPNAGTGVMMDTWLPPPPLALTSPSQYNIITSTGFLSSNGSSGATGSGHNTTTVTGTGSSMVTPRQSMLGLQFSTLPGSPHGNGPTSATPQSPSRNTTTGGSMIMVGSPKVPSNRQSITTGSGGNGTGTGTVTAVTTPAAAPRAGAYAFEP